jgi:hypothetical protein
MRSSPFHGASEQDVIKAAEQSLQMISGSQWPPSKEMIDTICGIECFVDHQQLLYAHFGV